jgi:hypothetical protein
MQARAPTRHAAMRGKVRSGSGCWKSTNLPSCILDLSREIGGRRVTQITKPMF